MTRASIKIAEQGITGLVKSVSVCRGDFFELVVFLYGNDYQGRCVPLRLEYSKEGIITLQHFHFSGVGMGNKFKVANITQADDVELHGIVPIVPKPKCTCCGQEIIKNGKEVK